MSSYFLMALNKKSVTVLETIKKMSSDESGSESGSDAQVCAYVFGKGKRKGLHCPVSKLYKETGYCKQHYERANPDEFLKPSKSKSKKIQEINSEGEPVEHSDFETDEPVPKGVDVIEVKTTREVYLDINYLIGAVKKTQNTDSKTAIVKKPKKSKKIVKAPKKRRKVESDDEAEENEDESAVSASDVSEGGQVMSYNRDKSLYVDCLRNAANCMMPMYELAVSKYTPLNVAGLSEEFAQSREVQEALGEVILENFPDSIEEATPTTKFFIALAALTVNVHARNYKVEMDRLKEQSVNPLIAEQYKDL
jgi:hypothetical protein